MFDKLDGILERYDEIMEQLNDPNVVSDQNNFRKLMKEQSDLAPIVEAYKAYKEAKQTVEDSLMILDEESDEETKALFLEGMKKSVEMASHAGVILAMEIMDTPFVGTILRAMHYIKEIRSPYFKIYPDMGNLTQFSADVESEFELGISETVAIHVKETNPGVFKCVPFGEGTVRFTDIFKKLKDLNYTGMFLIEMWADNTKKQTMEEAVETIRQARLFVEDKMEQAGIKVPA